MVESSNPATAAFFLSGSARSPLCFTNFDWQKKSVTSVHTSTSFLLPQKNWPDKNWPKYNCTLTLVVVPRLPRGKLNRGAVCVRMHLRSCTDVKEPGWPSESLGVQKQAYNTHWHTVLQNRSWADCNKGVHWGKQMTGPHATPENWGTQQQQHNDKVS